MNNPTLLKVLFWLNVFFAGLNLLELLTLGSVFAGLVFLINAYAAYTFLKLCLKK